MSGGAGAGAGAGTASGSAPYRTPAGPLRALVEELVRAGVRDAVVCPGSRSTPIALALRANPAIRTWLHLDERAGAYFALGAARASRRPTVILGTSGTAVVNFAPAVVEAREGRVPLVVLTADRPPELRDRSAPQAIDQSHLYGRFAKWYVELPVPEESALLEAHLRGVVGRAVAMAVEVPAGPVHVNLPFREPLVPEGSLEPEGAADEPPHVEVLRGRAALPEGDLARLADRLSRLRRGLIVCGPLDLPGFPEAVACLAAASGFPILADGLSNVRLGRHDRSRVVARHDAIVRSERFRAAHVPDLIIRFGGTPTSTALVEMLAEQRPRQIVVDDGGWAEPTLRAVTMVHAEPVGLAAALAEAVAAVRAGPAEVDWLGAWLAADRTADAAIRGWLATLDEPFEGAAFADLEGVLPDGTVLVAGNSMPVRDMDAFLPAGPAAVRCLANRGANGIDGVVSTTLGIAAVHDGPVALVVGDLSFVHDLNALVAARLHPLSATIVLVNNDGGGIFSFLPQASAARPEVGLPDHFEELFGTPHGLDLGRLVAALGGEHRQVGPGEIGPAVAGSLDRPGVRVLELRTDRTRNVALHRASAAAVSDALGRLLAGAAGVRP
ncbi:MAG: 2-succinyl-5-enolpyruvyl-6-hydroxy-3-cyclohexene-1-carboxylic-acid synthase [Chloroflexi bacterium]|nr:2-succinyl-5-enolpyruvyl-6-hydroxy-3-cyclohexene-1-carboxylic-acid synthase [Chloroflexota bacterium]